jgi:hypothetical protein
MKPTVLLLITLSLTIPAARAAVATDIPTTQPAPTTRTPPVHQLTTLVSSAVIRIEKLPPTGDHDAKASAIIQSLIGERVYGSVIVDAVAGEVVTAHLQWHDKATLNADEQAKIAAAKAQADQAQAAYASAYAAAVRAQNNSRMAAANSRFEPRSSGGTTPSAASRDAAAKNLRAVTDEETAEATARLPTQTVAISTDDPKTASLQPKMVYVCKGYITGAAEFVDKAGFVSFAMKIDPTPPVTTMPAPTTSPSPP